MSSTGSSSRGRGSSERHSGILPKLLAVAFVGLLAWAYKSVQPPEPAVLGAPGGPPITGSRITLRDGRHLAYKEYGLPRDSAKYKIVFIHGFHGSRHDPIISDSLSKELMDELEIHVVVIDRPGYGESTPDPKRTAKSIALDIEEVADQLGLVRDFTSSDSRWEGRLCGVALSTFLTGAALIAPAVNYWWPGFPSNLSTEAYYRQLPQDQWASRVAHYTPWLTYWWNTRNWIPPFGAIVPNPKIFSESDLAILMNSRPDIKHITQARQQGDYESLHRDLMVGLGRWEFDPMGLEYPFPEGEGEGEGSVQLWQGDEDKLVPATLQRYIAQSLPWIKYHEVSGAGHMFPLGNGMIDEIVKALLHSESVSP